MPPNLPPKPGHASQPPRPPLTFDGLMRLNGFAALGSAFQNPQHAAPVLDRIGFPQAARPNFNAYPDAESYWREICLQVDGGRTEGGLEALMASAAHDRPYNRLFSQYTQQHTPPPVTDEEANHTPSLFVISRRPSTEVLNLVRREAARLQIPGQVELEVSTETGLTVFGFDRATPEQVLQLGEAVRIALAPQTPVRVNMAANGDRSTLLDRLFAEGPDGTRYELTRVPADTRPREIARAVMENYTQPGEQGPSVSGRPVVIDHIGPEGTTRLNPDEPIGHQGVCEGDRLEVQPQSEAAVDPILRGTALVRVRNEVVKFCTEHPGVVPEVNEPITPTEYVFTFDLNSWAPPDLSDGAPKPITRHEVFVRLPSEFPMEAPIVQWLTPIYHPNINPTPDLQIVCLGELKDQYEPGLDFGKLLQMLLDIAAYRNYRPDSPLNGAAARWTLTDAGMSAIESRGGVSQIRLIRRALSEVLDPERTFGIRKLGAS